VYTLQAIVGSRESLRSAALERLITVALTDHLVMVPLTDDVLEHYHIPSLPLTDGDGADVVVPPSLDLLCAKLSAHGLIVYVEAEFFGGVGEQAHVLFQDGVALGPPIMANDAINRALRHLGVVSGGHHDEFEAVGLGRFRSTEKWTGGPNRSPAGESQ
jgi:hypothetical protein